jgi:TP901 family phage tail tape measure protein
LTSTTRTVKTSLVAEVSGYIAGYEKAAKVTRDLGTEAEKLAAKKDAINQLGAGLLAIGAVAAVGVGLAVKAFSDFETSISAVKAATQETTANMALLREAALDAGASSVFTATEAANAIEELGKAGLTTQQILEGGLDGALALASAGAIGVAEAAQTAAIAVKQFGLDGADVPHVADLLAAGAGKAVGSVQDLGAALAQSGLVADQTGLSIEDTTGILAAFADKGLLGSDAGTSFKTMLQSLTPSSKEAAAEIERLGLSAYDSQGNFIGITEWADKYTSALSKQSDQQNATTNKIIFGADAVRAANVFYDLGAEGIQKYIDQTNDSGYAAQVAADRLDNLTGDVEKLGGSFETALIRSGSGANDTLRTLTQTATFLVDTLGSAPTPVLNAGLAIGAVAAATALAGGAALIGVPKFMAFKATLDLLHISGKRAAIGIAATGGALGVATIAIGYFVGRQAQMAGTTAALVDTLDEATGALTKYSREFVKKELAESGAFKSAKEAGVSQRELTDAVLEGGDALDTALGKIGDNNTFGSFFTGVGVRAGNASADIRDLRTSVEDSTESWKDQKAAGDDVAETSEAVAEQTKAVEQATIEATEAQQAYIAELAELDASFVSLGDGYNTIIQKNQEVAQATADATESADDSWEDYYDGFSFSLADYLTELQTMVDAQNNWETNMILLSGRVSSGVLDELAKLGPEGAELVAGLTTASADELAKLEELYGEKGDAATSAFASTLMEAGPILAAAAAQLGEGAAAEIAQKLADGTSTIDEIMYEYKLKVEGYVPSIQVDATGARQSIADFVADLNNIPGRREVVIAEVIEKTGAARGEVGAAYPNANGNIHAYASGGFPTGIYAGRAGSIHKFAEPETGWEAYISGRPGQEARNASIAFESLDRLGVPAPTYVPASDRQYAAAGSSSTTKTLQHTTNINGVGVSLSEAQAAAEFDRNQALRGL